MLIIFIFFATVPTKKQIFKWLSVYYTYMLSYLSTVRTLKNGRDIAPQKPNNSSLRFPSDSPHNGNGCFRGSTEIVQMKKSGSNGKRFPFPACFQFNVSREAKLAQVPATFQPNFAEKAVNGRQRFLHGDINVQPIFFVVRSFDFQQIAFLSIFVPSMKIQKMGFHFSLAKVGAAEITITD